MSKATQLGRVHANGDRKGPCSCHIKIWLSEYYRMGLWDRPFLEQESVGVNDISLSLTNDNFEISKLEDTVSCPFFLSVGDWWIIASILYHHPWLEENKEQTNNCLISNQTIILNYFIIIRKLRNQI